MAAKKKPKENPGLRDVRNRAGSDDMLDVLSEIVSFDGGNGLFQLRWKKWKTKFRALDVPHARARVSGEKVVSETAVMKLPWAEFRGTKWAYGDAVFSVPGLNISTHQNTKFRYGDESHIFFLLVMMATIGVPSNSAMRLVVSVPPALYGDIHKEVQQAFLQGDDDDGWFEITLNEKGTFRYRFKSVTLLREGEGAWWAYRADLDGRTQELPAEYGDALGGAVTIGDGGQGTFDQYSVVSGRVAGETLRNSTDPTMGIHNLIVSPILNEVKRITGQQWLKGSHVDKWLRDYAIGKFDEDGNYHEAWSPEAAKVVVNGLVLELADEMDEQFRRAAREVITTKVDVAASGVMNAYMPVGGIWLFIDGLVYEARPNVHYIEPTIATHTNSFKYYELNVVGGLAFAAAYLRRKQPELT